MKKSIKRIRNKVIFRFDKQLQDIIPIEIKLRGGNEKWVF
ncbi:MAG: hypothetical protein ACJAX4_002858 [Clostridium sp.]|jgi:hypothetical protein